MMGRFATTVSAVIAFLALTAVTVGIAAFVYLAALDKPSGTINVEGTQFAVGQGESGASVARRLAADGAIRSELLFRLLMKARGFEQSLKAGDYLIKPEQGSSSILEMIAEGRQVLVRLTVPEGASLQAIARVAEAAGVANAADVIAAASDPALAKELGLYPPSAVGYLFPDTYLLPRNAGGQALVKIMVETFGKRLSEAVPESAALSPRELHDRVVLASIVEREYRVADEAPLMASAFLNRLRIGMALQSCATVVYVITDRLGKQHPSRIFDRDLKLDDPFNTYLHPGLPPEPICNPGLTALSASLRPATSDFLYFRLVDEASGRHYFSETLDEHIQAAALSVKPRSP
jgi:UPF0755 protein